MAKFRHTGRPGGEPFSFVSGYRGGKAIHEYLRPGEEPKEIDVDPEKNVQLKGALAAGLVVQDGTRARQAKAANKAKRGRPRKGETENEKPSKEDA